MTDRAHAPNGRGAADVTARVQALEMEAVERRVQLDSHERACNVRQQAILTALSNINATLADQATKVGSLMEASTFAKGLEQGAARARKPKWWMEPVLAALLGAALMTAGWVGNHLLEGVAHAPPVAAKAN